MARLNEVVTFTPAEVREALIASGQLRPRATEITSTSEATRSLLLDDAGRAWAAYYIAEFRSRPYREGQRGSGADDLDDFLARPSMPPRSA